MKRHHLFDNIAWWLAWNVVAAIFIAMLMSIGFAQFAGVWAQPPLENTGLLGQIVGITRVMDQLPAAERPVLAEKLGSPAFVTRWYPSRAQVPAAAGHEQDIGEPRWVRLTEMLGRHQVGILAGDGNDSLGTAARTGRYAVAFELSDHSWVGFDTNQRSWGISRNARIILTLLFVLIASSLIAGLASRRLARPVQRFAKAADKFGAGASAEPLQLSGPLEIREAAAAFNAMQSRIQRLVDSRTEMLTAISHDLRAPLTRMRLRGEFIDDAEQQRKLFRDVDEMQAMIEASLAFFRFDGKEEAMTRFELAELIQTVLDDFRDLGQSVSSAGLQHWVYLGRPSALKRALTNLVDNAVKYAGSATVTLCVQEQTVIITVDDTGAGVPPALIPKMFQPFFRGEPSRNRATGGYGLGLASAWSIVRHHGGELTLNNRQPHGLRATITLPIMV